MGIFMAYCKNILIIEDDPEIRACLKEVLEDVGYPVRTATNGQEALNILHSIEKPCLILLDWMMPIMDGQQFLEFKQHDVTIAPIPVIIVSATAERNHAVDVAGLIKKPFNSEILIQMVKLYCGEP